MKRLVIEVCHGCVNVASEIPDGVELVIKDYDTPDSEAQQDYKKDSKGKYDETVWTPSDNEGLLAKFKREKK
jgi:hypothetical protein